MPPHVVSSDGHPGCLAKGRWISHPPSITASRTSRTAAGQLYPGGHTYLEEVWIRGGFARRHPRNRICGPANFNGCEKGSGPALLHVSVPMSACSLRGPSPGIMLCVTACGIDLGSDGGLIRCHPKGVSDFSSQRETSMESSRRSMIGSGVSLNHHRDRRYWQLVGVGPDAEMRSRRTPDWGDDSQAMFLGVEVLLLRLEGRDDTGAWGRPQTPHQAPTPTVCPRDPSPSLDVASFVRFRMRPPRNRLLLGPSLVAIFLSTLAARLTS